MLADRYVSADWLARENRLLWPRVWWMAGPAVDVAASGQRFAVRCGPESVLVVRDGHAVRAFHNACPHRGHPLCEGAGSGRAITCPYHHWRYGLDGRLQSRPDPQDFPDDPVALVPVRCAVHAGMVWVCLSQDGPELLDWLGPVADALATYRIDQMALSSDASMPLACNWKHSVDVHNESYHVHALHPQTLPMVDDTAVRITRWPPHAEMVVPFGRPSARLGSAAADPALRARMHNAMPDGQTGENHMFYVFPNLQLNCYANQVMAFRHRPHPTDPGRCTFDQLVWVRQGSGRVGEHRALVRGRDSLGEVTDADLDVVERLQVGVASSGFRGPILGEQEALIRGMHDALDAWVGRDG